MSTQIATVIQELLDKNAETTIEWLCDDSDKILDILYNLNINKEYDLFFRLMKYEKIRRLAYDASMNSDHYSEAEKILIDAGPDYFELFREYALDYSGIKHTKLILEIIKIKNIQGSHYKLIGLLCNDAIKEKEEEDYHEDDLSDDEDDTEKEDDDTIKEIIDDFKYNIENYANKEFWCETHLELLKYLTVPHVTKYINQLKASDPQFKFIENRVCKSFLFKTPEQELEHNMLASTLKYKCPFLV